MTRFQPFVSFIVRLTQRIKARSLRYTLTIGFPILMALSAQAGEPLRIGIIGCDTSHVPAFTKVLNAPDAEGPLAAVQVVAAYPGGSDDIPSSRDRVEGYTTTLREMGIEITNSIEDLLERVDVVMLESVDGRPHLEQARPVLVAGKPIFIDKPLAGSLADAVEIFALAKKHGTPCFSASSLRYSPATAAAEEENIIGKVLGCAAYSPCALEPHHPDLFWYGVHGVETLFTIMGPGCQQVTRVQTDDTELVVGVWADGRVGTFRGLRTGKRDYGATIFGSKAIQHVGGYTGYEPLVVDIARFFVSGKPPVAANETIEIFAFMEAADESKRQGGAPVTIQSVLKKAQKLIAEK